MVDAALDFHVDSGQPVSADQPAYRRPDKTRQTTVPTVLLPTPAPHVLKTLLYFRQATSSQLRRLHYRGTERGQIVRASKHLKRMAELKVVRRVWGVYTNIPEYVYLLPDSKARAAGQHTLDITELYVHLKTQSMDIVFDPEPWRWYKVGPTGLKPDAYVDAGRRFFLEMDEGTEYRAALTKKMRQYVTAYGQWTEQRFPQVLFVCHDPDRLRFIERVIEEQSVSELFSVCLFGDTTDALTR